MRVRVKEAKDHSEESRPLCVSVYAVSVWVKEWKTEEKNRVKCVGSFCACMFVFVGVDHPINYHLHHPPPSAAGWAAEAETVKPHPKQTPRYLCYALDSRSLEFLFSKRRSLSRLTCADLVRHAGLRPHLKLAQVGCLAETDTATWICTLTICSKVGYWCSQTCQWDLSVFPQPPPLPSFLHIFPESERPKALAGETLVSAVACAALIFYLS